MGGKASVAAATAQIEDWGQLNTFLGEVSRDQGRHRVARPDRHAQQARRRPGGHGSARGGVHRRGRVLGPGQAPRRRASREDGGAEPADLVVVAGGNLALIYFNASKERMTLEEIDGLYPDLVQALANHPGIGVLIVRSAAHGLIAVGKNGIHFLDEERVEGEDPAGRVRRARGRGRASASTRSSTWATSRSISLYDPETDEIAAFEELIGAHGGLGGAQTRPFLLYPSDWELDLAPLMGAPMVYQQLRRWMER